MAKIVDVANTILGIESATSYLSVGLYVDGALHTLEDEIPQQHAQHILPYIDVLLKTHHTRLEDLDAIAFGSGPGSFTGLRIACSVAKGLAYAHNLPLIPISNLHIVAEAAAQQYPNTPILSIIDARMQEIYWSYSPQYPSYIIEDECVAPAHTVVLPGDTPVILAGVGCEMALPDFNIALRERIVGVYSVFPNVRTMMDLVVGQEIQSVNAAEAEIRYIRNKVTHN